MAKRKTAEVPAAPPSAEYTVLARRYRPQQFADLIGQEAVAQARINALQSGRVAHAYLFTGARGVGKTSAARILAKALNCVKGPTPTPCDQCEICQAITSGQDTDTIEIDGASNNGVDNIRELRANVQFRPSRSRYKIYVIDEVHMLSTPAFNALLKTLEEPPPHVKFIFATTEIQKVPITILSRCQRFDFGNISIPRILDRLKSIVAAEGMEADDEALETVARRAGGSMRDGQSLLDQLLAFSGKKLTVDTVHQLLGTAHEERVTAIAGAALAKDAKQVLDVLNEIVNQGQQSRGELLDQAQFEYRARSDGRQQRRPRGTDRQRLQRSSAAAGTTRQGSEPRHDPYRDGHSGDRQVENAFQQPGAGDSRNGIGAYLPDGRLGADRPDRSMAGDGRRRLNREIAARLPCPASSFCGSCGQCRVRKKKADPQ